MPEARLVRDGLARILASSVFENSPRMRRFLAFVVEETLNGRASQIKEYAIAIEVFEKRPDYDPRTDSTVRTEASKLRSRLDRYYVVEGAADTLVISLPKGAYVPVFRDVEVLPPTAENADPLTSESLPERKNAGFRNSRTRSVWPRIAVFLSVAAISLAMVIIAGIWGKSWVQRQRTLAELEAKGSVFADSWSGDELLKGIAYYRQLLVLDPKSAGAYAEIASAYVLLSDVYMAPREAMPQAALAATRAVELDSRLAEPHASLGMVKLEFDWDWAAAESEFKRAIALGPDDMAPHQLYGWYLMAAGRFGQARMEMQHALALDSSDNFSVSELGLCDYFAREYDEAAEQDRRAIALQPKSWWPHMLLGWTLEQQGKVDRAISEMTIASKLANNPQTTAALAHAQAVAGRRASARQSLAALIELSKTQYVSPYDIATVYAGLGDTEQTLAWLEKALEDRSGWLPLWLLIDPKFDGVRGQARFSALLRRVGHGTR